MSGPGGDLPEVPKIEIEELLVKAKKMINTMSVGEKLEVLATDPGSVADFQGWAKVSKHAELKEQRTEKDENGKEIYVHVVERTA